MCGGRYEQIVVELEQWCIVECSDDT